MEQLDLPTDSNITVGNLYLLFLNKCLILRYESRERKHLAVRRSCGLYTYLISIDSAARFPKFIYIFTASYLHLHTKQNSFIPNS